MANDLRSRRLCLVLESYAHMLEAKLELIIELDFAKLKINLAKRVGAY